MNDRRPTDPTIDALMPDRPPIEQRLWGYLGAAAAAWFAIWMLFFPQYVPAYFAWDVQPRYAQAFIAAGYVFRTAFFLVVAREPNWLKIRWIVWGNLAFTGTLLLATYWHIDEFSWPQFTPPTAHIWIILYIFEPVTMLYLLPRGILRAPALATGGPLHPLFRKFLVLTTGLFLMHALLLIINPEFAARRWPWELNQLDARMIAAWFLGWSFWAGTMAFAADWDEIRVAARLFILNGVALGATIVLFAGEFTPGRQTISSYAGGVVLLTVGMVAFYVVQERRRQHRPAPDAQLAPVAG
jgi:hypothetical protein